MFPSQWSFLDIFTHIFVALVINIQIWWEFYTNEKNKNDTYFCITNGFCVCPIVFLLFYIGAWFKLTKYWCYFFSQQINTLCILKTTLSTTKFSHTSKYDLVLSIWLVPRRSSMPSLCNHLKHTINTMHAKEFQVTMSTNIW